jgi:hypothetical protein
MSVETISINKNRENLYEFETTIEGITPQQVEFRFIIEDNGNHLGYKCIRKDNNKWYVKLPYDSRFTQVSYPFYIESIIDGYYFKTLSGLVKIYEKDIDVNVQSMHSQNTTPKPEVVDKPTDVDDQPTDIKPQEGPPEEDVEKQSERKLSTNKLVDLLRKKNTQQTDVDEDNVEHINEDNHITSKPIKKAPVKAAATDSTQEKKRDVSKKVNEALIALRKQEEEKTAARLAQTKALEEAEKTTKREEIERKWLEQREKERKVKAILNKNKD